MNRASLLALKKGIIYKKKFKMRLYTVSLIFPLRRWFSQVSWLRETKQRYNVCLRLVSLQDMLQRIYPNGRHIWSRYKERIADNENRVFPCENNSYVTAQTDK